jgi:SAM-dependent methyltransferase
MLTSLKQNWERGQDMERAYWGNFITTMLPQQSHEDYFDERVGGFLKFQYHSLIEHVVSSPVRIIDVGAGPVTHVGTWHPSRKIEVTPIDPLAEFYSELLSEFDITPVTPTISGTAEHLEQLFRPGTFDFAFSRNALEHCGDPLTALSQVFSVLKPGCYFCLCGNTNESAKQNYQGSHLWNFDVREGAPILWRPGITIDLAITFVNEAIVTKATDGSWYTIEFCKTEQSMHTGGLSESLSDSRDLPVKP